MFVSCFVPEYNAIFHALKIAKKDCSFSPFTRFWAYKEASDPHFSALEPQNSTSVPLFRCPEPRFSYPKTPFGMSHFTFWGIPFHHLGYIFGTFAHNVQPRFSVCLLRFRCKSLCVSFLSVHHVFHDSFGWISQFL